MNKFSVLWLLVIVPIASAQAPKPGTYAFSKRHGDHIAKIVIRTRAFDPSKHKISYARSNYQTTIDGRLAYGAEQPPRTEIATLNFHFDGQRIPVARHLYTDCYEPNVYRGKGLGIGFSRDFRRVFVTAFGSDGAGSYHVVWVLGRNGRHRRYFKPTF